MNYTEALTLNNKTYSKEELVQLTESTLNSPNLKGYEKSLYSFIKEWISPSEIIKVKTSGTTGEPKEITFLKSQAIASATMTCNYFKLNKNTNALLSLSTEFIGGKMMVVRAFVSGMNLIIIKPTGNPLIGLNDKIDFASMVPLQVYNCLQDAKTKEIFIAIPNVIIGGGEVSPALENMLADCPNNVYSTFAMTETLSHIALRKLSGAGRQDYTETSSAQVYETLPGVDISTDERGCLLINAPSLNEKTIITNDVVEIINSTQFRWLGRYDSVINSGGIKIHPEIVERKLSTIMPDNRFFITSLPDEKLGQKMVMIIECAEDFNIGEIIKLVENALTKYEIPKEYYRVGKFIETGNGKIKKGETLRNSIIF